MTADAAELIGVDWGTSNLRVMRLAHGGGVLDSRSDPRGAGGLSRADFRPVLEAVAGDWLDQGLPVLVCGMAGARDRWIDMGYATAPAGLSELAEGLGCPEPDRDWFVVPGVAQSDLGDLMRGEETQVMGLTQGGFATVVAPGTHSKWITVEGGRILNVRTYMTGELFHALRTATILGQGMGEAGHDEAAFLKGVDRGLSDGALTHALFSTRTEVLADRLTTARTADYLSGLLIGAEIAARDRPEGALLLVGAPELAGRYRTALLHAGFPEPHMEDGLAATARGLWRIRQARTA